MISRTPIPAGPGRGPERIGRAAAAVALALAFAAFAPFAAGPSVARATSVYSVGGLGEPQLDEGARVRALGGAGVAEFGVDLFSQVNPASTAGVRHLLIQGTIVPAYRRVSGPGGSSESASETEVPLVRALVRLPGRFVLGASYAAGTDAQFHIDRAETAGTASTLRIEGTGGMQLIRISASREISPSLRFGIDHEIVAGNYREEWTRDFADPDLATSRDTLESRYERLGRWRLGMQGTVRGWTVGGVVETKRRLPLTSIGRAAGSTVERGGKNLTIPSGFAVGFSTPEFSRWRVAAQYRLANWGRSSLESDFVALRASQRVSLGIERVGRKGDDAGSWRSRLPIRLGVSFLQWPDLLPLAGSSTVAGGTAAVNEWAVSLGTGIVTQDKGGNVDLSLEAGSRGGREELGVSERFLRAALTLQIGDDSWR